MKDVVSYIQENINPLVLLNYYNFRNVNDMGEHIRACCAIHNGDNPSGFIWKKSNNLWFCYTGECGGGDIFTLIQKMENVDFQTAVRKAASILGLEIEGMPLINADSRILKEQKKWIQDQQRKRSNHAFSAEEEYTLPFTKYYESLDSFTRFDDAVLQHYHAKFCKLYPTDESMCYNKLVIPIYENNICMGVALRDTTGSFNPKWMYMPKGLKINKLLYNFDEASNYEEVILVEGIFDVWAYHKIGIDNVVAIFGSSIGEEQYKKLMKLGVNITLSFDNDKAGRKCAQKAMELFKNKAEIKMIELPEGSDPDDVEEGELLSRYLSRRKI